MDHLQVPFGLRLNIIDTIKLKKSKKNKIKNNKTRKS